MNFTSGRRGATGGQTFHRGAAAPCPLKTAPALQSTDPLTFLTLVPPCPSTYVRYDDLLHAIFCFRST